jgi:hypothetical protein
MAAGKYSFIIEQGSTVDFTIVYNDSNGNPVNLSRYGSKMQIRQTYGSAPLLTLSSSLNADGTGLNMSNAASGAIEIYIASCTSSMLTFNEAIYDLDISTTRNIQLTTPYSIEGCAFRVNSGPDAYPGFEGLTEATFVNTGVYAPPFNLSDFFNTKYVARLGTFAGAPAQYYLQQVVSALNSLGISLSCP